MNSIFSPVQQFLISWILILIAGGLTLQTLNYVGELVTILIVAGLIAFILNAPVAKLKRFIPRGVAAALVYLVAATLVVIVALTVVPPVLNQTRQFIAKLPELAESGQQQLALFQAWSSERNLPFDVGILQQQLLNKLQGQAQAIATKSLGLVLGTFNWFIDLILIVVLSFYMLLDGDKLWSGLTRIISPKIRVVLTESLQRNLQKFLSGQFILGLFIALTLAPMFFFLGVPYFLLFAVFIGFMEIIPFIGATLGIGTVTIIVAFLDWWLALQLLIIAVAVQQVKDNIIAPRIMGNLTGLSPVVILSALLLGGKVSGLLGVILAIPLTGVIKSIIEIILNPQLPPQTGSFFTTLPQDIDNSPNLQISEITNDGNG
ncbi:MAG: AI-2E family transporter [Arthrospira sp. PLM2.Bin9]|nr:AI-2E family transporter [Arthrospira sp. PLM2.Bin9]TVU52728.1 MAG: AI-2E family transporter [Arthrospira sp. PLM2.Bin9]